MQVGQAVTYTPTTGPGKPQAAIVTDWNADTSKAGLIVFPANAYYGLEQLNVSEGTDPGTFQQLTSGATASAPAAASTHATTSKK